jgi:predicted phage terminase large subunit-like protein
VDVLGREPGVFMPSARGRSQKDWARAKAATSPRIWSALFQGRPSPAGGAVWLRPWWQRYSEPLWVPQGGTCRVLPGMNDVFTSWDMTFKDTKGSDYVVGQVWGRRGAEMFLLDQVRARMSFTKTVEAFVALAQKWPDARKHLVEDKANGPAVISTLSSKVPGILPITPHDSKLARANAVAVYIQAGNVKLPADGTTSWDPDALITEAAAFPTGAHDDQVDAASQALAHAFVDSTGAAAWLEWLKNRIDGTRPRQVEAPVVEPMVLIATTDAERRQAARNAQVRGLTAN